MSGFHAAADALLYHAPNVCAFAPGQERPMRRRPGQPLVVYSMESVGGCLSLASMRSHDTIFNFLASLVATYMHLSCNSCWHPIAGRWTGAIDQVHPCRP